MHTVYKAIPAKLSSNQGFRMPFQEGFVEFATVIS